MDDRRLTEKQVKSRVCGVTDTILGNLKTRWWMRFPDGVEWKTSAKYTLEEIYRSSEDSGPNGSTPVSRIYE